MNNLTTKSKKSLFASLLEIAICQVLLAYRRMSKIFFIIYMANVNWNDCVSMKRTNPNALSKLVCFSFSTDPGLIQIFLYSDKFL